MGPKPDYCRARVRKGPSWRRSPRLQFQQLSPRRNHCCPADARKYLDSQTGAQTPVPDPGWTSESKSVLPRARRAGGQAASAVHSSPGQGPSPRSAGLRLTDCESVTAARDRLC